MTHSEILEKINMLTEALESAKKGMNSIRLELDVLRSMLTPPKKRGPKRLVKRDYSNQINASLRKNPIPASK